MRRTSHQSTLARQALASNAQLRLMRKAAAKPAKLNVNILIVTVLLSFSAILTQALVAASA